MNKNKKLKVSAVIVAAGTGSRMKMGEKKQFLSIGGLPVIVHCLKVFENCDQVDDIIIVLSADDMDYFNNEIYKKFGFKKIKSIAAGGNTRQQSVYSGLSKVEKTTDIVMIHDGARPFVKEEELIASINAAQKFGAACIAVPVKDTIKVVDSSRFVQNTPNRANLWAVQTPQTFKYDTILKIHSIALEKGITGSDDASLAEACNIKVYICEGRYDNIKITTKEDLIYAQYFVTVTDDLKQ